MDRNEFDEFYEFITRFALVENGQENVEELKELYWKVLRKVPFVIAKENAKDVYKLFLEPCNLNQLSPKVFSGENPNPGLYARIDRMERFYM